MNFQLACGHPGTVKQIFCLLIFVIILCFIWELRLFVISTKFSNNFIFINLHDINKSNFVVVVMY